MQKYALAQAFTRRKKAGHYYPAKLFSFHATVRSAIPEAGGDARGALAEQHVN